MRNEPNLRQSQIFTTIVSTISYNEKLKLDTWSKRTQTKPILVAAKPFGEDGFYFLLSTFSIMLLCYEYIIDK